MKRKSLFLLPLRCVLFILAGLSLSAVLSSPLEELSKWWTAIVSFCNIITIIILLLICRAGKATYGKFINYEKGKTKTKAVILTTLVILVVGMGGMQIAGFVC